VLKLVETSYHEHFAYSEATDALHAWIISTVERVQSLTADIDCLSKEQLETAVGKLNVIFSNVCCLRSCLFISSTER